MHNFFKLDGYNEDTSLSIEVETFEDLTKNRSDRYEYNIQILTIQKNLQVKAFQDLLIYHLIFTKSNLIQINIHQA